MSDLWTDIELDSDSSYDGSRYEGIKYQENPEDQEKEEVVSVPRRTPMRLILGDQRSLRHLKSEIEKSKDKIIFIKNIAAGSTQDQWDLV